MCSRKITDDMLGINPKNDPAPVAKVADPSTTQAGPMTQADAAASATGSRKRTRSSLRIDLAPGLSSTGAGAGLNVPSA